jgi:hypothetical protein
MLGNLISYIERKAKQKRQRQAKCAAFVEKNFRLLPNGMYWQVENPNYLEEANEISELIK